MGMCYIQWTSEFLKFCRHSNLTIYHIPAMSLDPGNTLEQIKVLALTSFCVCVARQAPVREISPAKVLDSGAISFSKGPSPPKDRTNPHLLHWQDSLLMSHLGSPKTSAYSSLKHCFTPSPFSWLAKCSLSLKKSPTWLKQLMINNTHSLKLRHQQHLRSRRDFPV